MGQQHREGKNHPALGAPGAEGSIADKKNRRRQLINLRPAIKTLIVNLALKGWIGPRFAQRLLKFLGLKGA